MIEKALVLSTAHVPDDSEVYTSCDLLFEDGHPRCETHVYGWIVFLLIEEVRECPEWFEPIRSYAMEKKASFVIFDQAASIINDLPLYDW
ncbi:MAG: hypothetical protein P1V36_00440 [Planctomycetota bacterium]|nr:hypothetical protein [Planctomycetota bacterium]